jgi:3-oxoacyl-[acyl-carrier-protein] synthase-1
MHHALGASLDVIWPRLLAGDQSGFAVRDDLVLAAPGPYGEARGELPAIPDPLREYACRNNQLAESALRTLAEPIAEAIDRFGAHRVGVVVGSSTSGFSAAEDAFRERAKSGKLSASFSLAQLEFGGLSSYVARATGAAGPRQTPSTACSTGAKALLSARSLLELGFCDAVIAGAVDSLCRLTANGFGALHAVSGKLTNPMSVNRDGLTLGEGAALFLVTRDEGGVQLLGGGESSDAHHMSAPHPEGRGAEQCMRAALADAGLTAADIAYLNLHGTGTPQNDAMESAAVSRVFGTELPCSSTKPLVGHTLGASGAIEAGFCWQILERRAREGGALRLPPHVFDGARDPALEAIALVGPQASVTPAGSARESDRSVALGRRGARPRRGVSALAGLGARPAAAAVGRRCARHEIPARDAAAALRCSLPYAARGRERLL